MAISAFTRLFDALCLAASCAAEPGPITKRCCVGPGSAEQREGRCTASGTRESLAARGLPGAAALVAGNDAAPAACTGIAGEPAASIRPRGADADPDRNAAVAGDTAGDLAATGR